MPRSTPSPAAVLKSAGLRRTPVRFAVLDLLARAAGPLGVPEMLGKLSADTDAVTVYRTLNTFTRKKLVHRVQADDRSWRYALGDSALKPEHRHPHFVCDTCRTVECLSTAEIPTGLARTMGVRRGYKVTYPEVVLHGQCPKCR
jgi:Fur family transcriptional regulator, ferric uptake regulator